MVLSLLSNLYPITILEKSVWDFTYQAGIKSIVDKIEGYSHAETMWSSTKIWTD